MNLQEIHDMAADALAGEELQFRIDGDWRTLPAIHGCPFNPDYIWRIKPTIEVNGVMMSKRQAKAAWEASGATSYEFKGTDMWHINSVGAPSFESCKRYRWQEAKWIYVNGVKIVRAGKEVYCYVNGVANPADRDTLVAAIFKLIEIK